MPRRRSRKIHTLKAKLVALLTDGFHRPGQRFLSNHAVARLYGVSYQTAHRIIEELERGDYLRRRSASGTYVAGRMAQFLAVALCFHSRAQQASSFGSYLIELLSRELKNAGIKFRIAFDAKLSSLPEEFYPVLWEVPQLLKRLNSRRRSALLLNDLPSPGFAASFTDANRSLDTKEMYDLQAKMFNPGVTFHVQRSMTVRYEGLLHPRMRFELTLNLRQK